MCCSVVFVCDVSNSPLCIGGYSVLPSANLLALGIIQARLPSALAPCINTLSEPFVIEPVGVVVAGYGVALGLLGAFPELVS